MMNDPLRFMIEMTGSSVIDLRSKSSSGDTVAHHLLAQQAFIWSIP